MNRRFYLRLSISFLVIIGAMCVGFLNSRPNGGGRADFSSSGEPLRIQGPLEDCFQSAVLYPQRGRVEPLATHCAANYVHYFSRSALSRPLRASERIRIGSFNLYHLGDFQARAKNLSMVAKIIDQWDIAGVQELMPLPRDWARNNQMLYSILARQRPEDRARGWTALMPGYLDLLHELRRLDPSWALVMQPVPEGDGTAGEMAGFYYRAQRVRLREWRYCPVLGAIDLRNKARVPNFACNIQVPEGPRRLMSRNAFSAYFQAGGFDFVGVTTHVRFRPEKRVEDMQLQAQDICANHPTPQSCVIPKQVVGRFFEVKAVADQLNAVREAARDYDVIYMGDFNLEMDPRSMILWKASLAGARTMNVYQPHPTTVGIKAQKLVSSYDHFVLDERASRECVLGSVRAIDLTQASAQNADPVLRGLGQLLSEEAIAKMVEGYERKVQTLARPASSDGRPVIVPLVEADRQKLTADFAQAGHRIRASRFAAVVELVSDHVPIEITCRTNQADDD